MKFLIVNGPNLNLLGTREPEIYGSVTFDDLLKHLQQHFNRHHIDYFQSNHEGEIIDTLQKAAHYDAVILNAGAFTHSSPAIADAINAVDLKVIEVHISNVHKREAFRHHSFISPVAHGIIIGLGTEGYKLAIQSLVN